MSKTVSLEFHFIFMETLVPNESKIFGKGSYQKKKKSERDLIFQDAE